MLNLHFDNNKYICKSNFDLKHYSRDAEFNWDAALKVWVTTSYIMVANILINLKKNQEQYSTTPEFDVQAEIARKALAKRVAAASKLSSNFKVPAPAGLDYLPYQKAGIQYAVNKGNALIADEMGLGKTIQAIGVINYKNAKKILVICPATLKSNWKRELKKWLVILRLPNLLSLLLALSRLIPLKNTQ